ncbi:MAG: hypothetical protein ACYTKD_29710, partial [Planctomycetota bacterium]
GILNTQEVYEDQDFEISSFELIPEGKHHMRIVSVDGELKDFDGYTGPRAKIKIAAVENGEPNEKLSTLVFLTLPHPQANPNSKNQRAMILSRLGFISRGDAGTAQSFDWSRLVGKDFIGTIEHQVGKDKNGKERTYANITYDGWEPMPGARENSGSDAPAGDFSDL